MMSNMSVFLGPAEGKSETFGSFDRTEHRGQSGSQHLPKAD